MIRLNDIKNENGKISCVAYVEGCKSGISVLYDVRNDVLAHGDIPEEYWWCSGHFSYAKRELKRMVESGVFRESTTVMWY